MKRAPFDLCEELLVLLSVLGTKVAVPRSKEAFIYRAVRVLRVPSNRIKFVITQNCLGAVRLNHASHNPVAGNLPWATVDVVPHKDCLTVRVSIGACPMAVSHCLQQRLQLISLSMHVSDDVVVQY